MFHFMERARVQDLHFRFDPETGLHAIIAIHDTTLGPALGGCRFIPYTNTDQAVEDAIRLAKGMTYKAALADVPQGGGKSVIIAPEDKARRSPEEFRSLFEAFGRFVQDLNGQYITAIDSGTTAREMDWIHTQTTFVTSTSEEQNPSRFTARGVFEGIKACATAMGHKDIRGLTVALQGLGNVGFCLARMLHEAGVKLVVSDIDADKVNQAQRQFHATAVPISEIYQTECDVFAPCGLGGIINDDTLPQLKCSMVAGSANNQLASESHGLLLHQKGILYAPDYVINSGGLIYASLHHSGHADKEIDDKTARISGVLADIFKKSRETNRPTSEVANSLAEQRLIDAKARRMAHPPMTAHG